LNYNLATRGLLTRTQDPVDRRNNLIALTKEGESYDQKLAPMLEQVYTSLNVEITSEELENTIQVLQKIYQKMTT